MNQFTRTQLSNLANEATEFLVILKETHKDMPIGYAKIKVEAVVKDMQSAIRQLRTASKMRTKASGSPVEQLKGGDAP